MKIRAKGKRKFKATTDSAHGVIERYGRHAKDLFESVDVTEEDPFINAILGSLNASFEMKTMLLSSSSNLYELLEEGNEPYLDILLELIDRSHPSKANKSAFIGTTAAIGLGALYQQGFLSSVLPFMKSLGQSLLSRLAPLAGSLKYWPLLGAGVELSALIATILKQRRLSGYAVLSKAIPATLALTGFTLWATATGLTPLAAGFLLASSSLNLSESGALLMIRRNKRELATRWEEFAAYLRDNWVKTQLASTFKTRLFTTLITGATLASVLINPALTLAGLLILSATPFAERLIGNHLKRGHLEKLQDKLRAIETPPDVRLCPSTRPAALSLLVRENRLDETESGIRLREAELIHRETLMQRTLTALEKGAYLRTRAPELDCSANEPVYALNQETTKGQDELYEDNETALKLMNQ